MPPLIQEHKHQALVQHKNGVFTCKIAALVDTNQSSIAHLRRDVGGDVDSQRGRRPKLLLDQDNKHCIVFVTEG